MTARDFAYWLQGLFELGAPSALDQRQTDLVKRHLAMVFAHEIDPAAGPPSHQAALDVLHAGLKASVADQGSDKQQVPSPGFGDKVYRC